MYVEFKIRCSVCGQVLNAARVGDGEITGLEYSHGNPADCSEPSVSMPAITPDQLAGLFKVKKAPARASTKKKSK